MIILNLIQNVALLVALAAAYQVIGSRFEKKKIEYQILSGLLFGGVGLVGMMTPVTFMPGIIFDGRSIILSVSGLFGGPLVAAVAATICGAFRLSLGGAGAWVGVSVIAESAAVGVLFYFLRKEPHRQLTAFFLYMFGLLVHVVMLTLMWALPGGVGLQVLRHIGLPILIVYPFATMLVCRLFLDYERQLHDRNALRESEERYRAVFENAAVGIDVTDADGRILQANESLASMLGYSREELLNLTCLDISHPEDPEVSWVTYEGKVRSDTGSCRFERRYVRKGGEILWADVSVSPVCGPDGGSVATIGVLADITDRKKSEEELKISYHRLDQIIQFLPDATFVIDDQGRVTAWNTAMEDLTGIPAENILSKGDYEYALPFYEERRPVLLNLALYWDDRYLEKYISVARREDGVLVSESHHPRLCGGIFLSGTARALYDAEGRPVGAIESLRNITEMKRAEKALKESERRSAQIIEFLPDPTMVIDAERRVIAWNKAMEQLTGVHASEMLGKGDYEYALPFYGSRRPVMLDLVLDFDHDVAAKYQFVTLQEDRLISETYIPDFRGRGPTWFWNVAAPLYDEDGDVVGAIEAVRDVTYRKKAEEAHRDLATKYQSLVERIPAILYIAALDEASTTTYISPQIETVLGFAPAEYQGDPDLWRKQLHPEDRDKVIAEVTRCRETGETFIREYRMLSREGGIVWFRDEAALVYDQDNKPLFLQGIMLDITDRKRAEIALKESEERYRTVVEQSFDGVFVQKGGVITFANSRLHEMLGYGPGEMEGLDHWSIYHADYQGIIRAKAQARLRGESVPSHYEVNLLRKDGSSFSGEINAKAILFDNEPGIQVWIRDLTEQKRLENRLVDAQRMEAVGTLAGGIAHDFNNLLHIIAGHAELLEMELAERKLKFDEMAAIRQAAKRGTVLVKQILTFSRRVETKFESINLNEEVQTIERLLYRTIPKMIEIDLLLEQGLTPVRADATQIEQVLINLAVNAKDAMPEGGRLTIETRNVILEEDYCRSHTEVTPGRYVLLRVSDTGHGMKRDVRQHIFEPFFTTKGLADGTGLGLAMVFGIVKMHGGHITCESEVGSGTTFSIYLPVAETAKAKVEQEFETTAVAGGPETILVVDDEELIRDLAKRILEMAGYSVVTAGSGTEAIQIYAQHKSDIALVILDLIMPETGGKQCLEELLKINPQVKVLIASGLAIQGDMKSFLDSEARGIVSKPFNKRELLRAVRHVLDAL